MKKLLWLILALAFITYTVVVWGWIQEGNRNFERQRHDFIDKR